MNSDDFTLNYKCSLLDVLNRLDVLSEKVVLIVDDSNRVLGTITDGDVRRALSKGQKNFFLLSPLDIMKKDFVFDRDDDLVTKRQAFSTGIKIIPVVDNLGRLQHLRKAEVQELMIGNTSISNESEAYIIAEIGNNHNGSLDLAFELIDKAKIAGANAAKFQMRQLELTYVENASNSIDEDLGSQYTLDLLNKFQLTNDQLISCFDYCKSIDIEPLCTPWDIQSVRILNEYGISAFKVASADMTNYELIQELSLTNKPVIFSTGMSSEKQIKYTVNYLDGKISDYALLHCNSAYPAPFKDINLKYLKKLKHISKTGIVGYSSHERGIEVPLAAVALGSKIIEKHFTLDKNMEGSDHKVSLLPDEFKLMVDSIRNIEKALIFSEERIVSQGEILNRESLGKSIVAARSITEGTTLSIDDLTLKGPGKGLSPDLVNDLIGMKASRTMVKDDIFFLSDLHQSHHVFSNYNFNREFGIPVRYHDLNSLVEKCNFNFVEFHLSYGDIGLDLNKVLGKTYDDLSFCVHAPELFKNDHILDLSSRDSSYRSLSIGYLKSVVDETMRIANFFPNSKKPYIVFNAGGFSENDFVTPEYRSESYKIIEGSLKEFKDLESCELLIQTMPPYPWHFGGQRFHNNFVNPLEIQDFCDRTGFNICLDLSHSHLACNFYDLSIDEFLNATKKYIKYMHIVDAKGFDGEGLQIGDGTIDFKYFSALLKKMNISAGFIPEIWQGHKDSGSGFIQALDRLEIFGL